MNPRDIALNRRDLYAEASQLGWAPGVWPSYNFAYRGHTWHEGRREWRGLQIICVHYYDATGLLRLTVIND